MEDNNISTLRKAYTTRVQKEKIKHKNGQKQVDIENSIKFQYLLEGMSIIRSAFRDLLEIDFGKRFSLSLVEDDYQGWPNLNLLVKDKQNIIEDGPNFVARVSDYNEESTIEFIFSGELKTLKIKNKSVVSQIPSYLRKNLRQYLDSVTSFVVENENNVAPLPSIDLDIGSSKLDNSALSESLGNDDLIDIQEDFSELDTLPILEEVEII